MDRSMKETLYFISEGSVVERFHTRPGIKPDTDGRHSHGVAMMCYLLYGGPSLAANSHGEPAVSATLLMAALTHDLGEQVASDVSAPSKRLLGIRDQLSQVEGNALKQHWLHYEDYLNPLELRTLKIADAFDGLLHCCRELAMGNKNFMLIFKRWYGMFCSFEDGYVFDGTQMTPREQHILSAIYEIYQEVTSAEGPGFDCFVGQ